MNFRIKEKLMLWISGSKKNLFQRNKLAQRWSFHSIYEAWAAHEMRKGVVQLYIKNNEVIFSLAWNIIFSDNWKVLVLKFLEMKNMVFLSQKVDGNMIFTDYWKVLVLIFSGMRNTAFFESKSCWKDDIYWLLKSSCFNLFGNGKQGLFLSQKVDGKMIFTDYWKVPVLIFSGMGNTVFFEPKSWWKDDIYLVFLSFPWYSRTWEIWVLN